MHRKSEGHLRGLQMRKVVRGRARQNSIVVGRIALSFRHRLKSAARASGEVAVLRGPPVHALDDRLRLHRHLVNAAMRPVLDDYWFRAPFDIAQVPSSALTLMTGVGTAHRVAPVQRLRHGPVRQLALKSAETKTLEAPVPVLERHPDSKLIAGSTTPATRQNERWTFTGAVSPMPFSVPGTAYSPLT